MKFLVLILTAMAVLPAHSEPAYADDGLVERGRQIYFGEHPLNASVADSAPLPAKLAACAQCHRPSGYGSSEGNSRTPAIAAPVLFAPLAPRRDRLIRDLYQERYETITKGQAYIPQIRPAYTGARQLHITLTQGRDPNGRLLSETMPRYDISLEDTKALTAYLRTLGATPDPGYDEREWHFATIFSADVPPAQVEATLAVMRSYIERYNREVTRELMRPSFSPGYKGEYIQSRRYWRLSVWYLSKNPADWPTELAAHYQSDPPFAILGGIVPDWETLAQFCNDKRLPCLFPQTDWPAEDPDGGQTVYLDLGLRGEIQTIAHTALAEDKQRILVKTDTSDDMAHVRQILETAGLTPMQNTDSVNSADAAVVVSDADHLGSLLGSLDGFAGPTYVAGGKLAQARDIDLSQISQNTRLTWRFAPPDFQDPQRRRARAWLRSQRIANPAFERAQLETWLTLEITRYAITRLVDRPSRAFFVESIEHLAETRIDPGLYASFSLGPGQRTGANDAIEILP